MAPIDRDAADGFDQGFFARIFVTPGATVSLYGEYGTQMGTSTVNYSFIALLAKTSKVLRSRRLQLSREVHGAAGDTITLSNATATPGNQRDTATITGFAITSDIARVLISFNQGAGNLGNGTLAPGAAALSGTIGFLGNIPFTAANGEQARCLMARSLPVL